MNMPPALMLWEVKTASNAPVMLDSLEMVLAALVSCMQLSM